MTFLNAEPKEQYDAAFSEYSKAPSVAPYENEKPKAGVFDNALGGLKAGAQTAIARGVFEAEPSRREEQAKKIFDLRPDPQTTGFVGQVLHGLADQLGTVAQEGVPIPLIMGMGGGVRYAESQTALHRLEGIDAETARNMGAIEGGTLGIGAVMPVSLTGKPVTRILSGAGMQAGFGAASRAMIQRTLLNNGYGEMAKQYDPFSVEALAMDAAFGGVFGVFGEGPAPKTKAPLPPSLGDAALVAGENVHAETLAPGVPTNTASRNAHKQALDTAITQMAMGKSTDIEGILKDAGFLGKRPDFDALSIIRGELEKAGVTDAVERLRSLEDEARSRGIILESDQTPSVVLSDKPAAVKVGGSMLGESHVKIGSDYVPTELRLVEAGDVAATMQKSSNQFRDRTRVASDQQIQSMAKNLDPALLGDAPVMDYGAPTLAADGTVIGGNGRAAAIARAYADGNADNYRAALGPDAEGMQMPMLVRVLKQDVDIQKAAMLSNEGGGMRMSALEQAKVDGDRLADFSAFQAAEDGRLDTVGNMPFIRAWIANIPENQRAALMDADGMLSAEGMKRLQNAVLYKAYGDSPVLSRLVESADTGSRNIATALTRVAPVVADARESIVRGELFSMDLADDLVGSVETLEGIKRSGMSVDEWMKQLDAFGDGLSAEARVLVGFFDVSKRSSAVMAEGIKGFYERLHQLGNPNQASMFEAAQPDKMHILQLALDEAVPKYSRGSGYGVTKEQILTNFRAQFGRDADRLLDTARVVVVDRVSDLPGDSHPADVRGMYWKGKTYIVAGNTPTSALRGLVLHEIGIHAGMREMLGDVLFADTLAKIEAKVATDPVFKTARALAEARSNRPEHVPEETLAYLVESAPELNLVRRVLAQVRQWLYRVTGGRFVDLTQADLQQMAAASLRRYAREGMGADSDVPWYMTFFHGTPNPFTPEPDAPLGRLRWKYINTGEGRQAFGYGHYVAQDEYIARNQYRDRLVSLKPAEPIIISHPEPIFKKIESMFRDNGAEGYMATVANPKQRIGDFYGGDVLISRTAADLPYSIEFSSGQSIGGFKSVDDANAWLSELLNNNPIMVNENSAFAWKFGDRIIHKGLGGEAQSLENAIVLMDKYGYAETKQTLTDVLDNPNLSAYDLKMYGDALRLLDDVTVENNGERVLRPDITKVEPKRPEGALYAPHIPDKHLADFMIWDAPMSAQPEKIRKAFENLGIGDESGFGFDAYQKLKSAIDDFQGGEGDYLPDSFGDLVYDAHGEIALRRANEGEDLLDVMDRYDPKTDEVASVMLHNLGIEGHKFLDGNSRSMDVDDPNANFNLVLYSDNLGRVAWEARAKDKEWHTANGKGQIIQESGNRFVVTVEGAEVGIGENLDAAMRIAESEMDGQFYSRAGGDDKLSSTGVEDPTEMIPFNDGLYPAGDLVLSAERDVATAGELSKGFLPAVECAMRVGQ